MEKNANVFQDLMPLLTKLIWPLFIVILLLVFNKESKDLYAIIKGRLSAGSSIKIGGFLELGEQARTTEINKLLLKNIPIEAIGGAGGAVEKSSINVLEKLRNDLKVTPHKRVDTLIIDDTKIYSPALLKDYVNTLGIRFIVFRQNGSFDGWIDSGIFFSQLKLIGYGTTETDIMRAVMGSIGYSELKRDIAGISAEYVDYQDSAQKALEKMQALHIEDLPVIKGKTFMFFANRGEILASLISSYLLEHSASSPEK